MKSFKACLFCLLFAAVCLPAVAQTQMQLDIPFNFVAAGKSLPAGHYKVSPTFVWSEDGWRVSNGHASAAMLTIPVYSSRKAHRLSLLFVRDGDRYSLAQIWPSEHSGWELPMRTSVKTIILTEGDRQVKGGNYVEIAAK